MTTDDALGRFEAEYQAYHNINPKRRREQLSVLRQFADSLDGRSIVEADAGDLQAFAGAMVARGLHVNSVRTYLNMVRPFVSWLYAVGLIDADHYMKLRTVKNPRGSSAYNLPNPYTRAEIKQFWVTLSAKHPKIPERGERSQALKRWLRGIGPWFKVKPHAMNLQITAMVRLALDMGLRRSEIYELEVDDLHYDLEFLIVRGKADPNTGEPKIREVPFTSTARAAIKDWLEFRALLRPDHNRPWLSLWFADANERPMHRDRFNELLQKTVDPGWRWHRFRHTCGTEWLRRGSMTLEQVSRLLGHATLQQTLGYAQILNSDLARAMERGEADFNEGWSDAA